MDTQLPDDLIGLAEAARLIPSRKPGKRIHSSTVYRWAVAGKLRAWRVGGCICVSRSDVLALFKRVEPPQKPERQPTQRQRKASRAWARKVLQDAGIDCGPAPEGT